MGTFGNQPLIKSKEQLEAAIADYFEVCKRGTERKWIDKRGDFHCETLPISPNVQGLALHIGFNDIRSLIDVESRNDSHDVYAPIITRAKTRIASEKLSMAEAGLLDGKVVTFYLAACHNMVPELNIHFTEQHQLGNQDRVLLGNLLKFLPGQLRALPQAVIDIEVEEQDATESSNLQEIED